MTRALPVLLLILSLIATACGGGDDAEPAISESPSASASPSPSEADDAPSATEEEAAEPDGAEDRAVDSIPLEELETYQAELNEVGCFVGAVDGTLGPQTEAAIRAFQAAEGLTVDGRLGPITEGALDAAVAAGETVCAEGEGASADDGEGAMAGEGDGGDGGGGALDGGEGDGPITVSVSAASYSSTFSVGSCASGGESDIQLRGVGSNDIVLQISASGGAGSIDIDGGDEEDAITLGGTVDSVVVGDDGSFTVGGSFDDGEAFTATGSVC